MADEPEGKRSFYDKYASAIIPVLLTALVTIMVTIISLNYQSKTTATQLISEREKAESELRASMFRDLIGPIVGDTKNITPERERLLVELLALNFGEHFELKPLLQESEKKLREAKEKARSEKERLQLELDLKSLRSVANRVSSRQIAMLLNQGTDKDRTVIIPLTFIKWADEQKDKHLYDQQKLVREGLPNPKQVAAIGNGETIRICSPDQKYMALVAVNGCNWSDEVCTAHVNVLEGQCLFGQTATNYNNMSTLPLSGKNIPAADVDFEFSSFDFPLNDNTLLPNGNRFALVRLDFEHEFSIVAFDFVWFPKVYFSPRERPINYADIRKKINIQPNH